MLLLGFLLCLTCVAASLLRLRAVLRPSALDLGVIAERTTTADFAERLRRALRACPDATWEAGLAQALAYSGLARTALLNEALVELSFRIDRFARVPRVCANVAMSSSWLFASLSLRTTLLAPTPVAWPEAALAVVDLVATGVAASVLCLAIGGEARRLSRSQKGAADRLIDAIERLDTAPGASML